MNIGIGLPATIPGVSGELLLTWAKHADDGPFSSLVVGDRVAYPNYEPLIVLAGAAGVTRRIRLMTTVLGAPLRSTVLLAKQAASLDALSGGRLTLGLGLGSRKDDYEAAGVEMHRRGHRFEQQLETMARIWSGEHLSETVGPVGPSPIQPGGPEVLLGAAASSPTAIKRVGHWNNGFIAGSAFGGPQKVAELFEQVKQAWQEAGRTGKPRLVACSYFGLGPHAAGHITETIMHYYAFLPKTVAQQLIVRVPSTKDALRALIETFEEMHADELSLWPCVADLDQIARLQEIISS